MFEESINFPIRSKQLGEGQYAVVEKARIKGTGEFVAVKRLKPKHYNTPEYDNFLDEIELLKMVGL